MFKPKALLCFLLIYAPLARGENSIPHTKRILIASNSDKTITTIIRENITEAIGNLLNPSKNIDGKLAVLDFPSIDGRYTGLSDQIANSTLNALIKVGKQVVDRSTLDRIIAEQKLQQNGLVDPSSMARLGKFSGASAILIGNYSLMGDSLTLTIRVLSVESAQFIAADEREISITGNALDQLMTLTKSPSSYQKDAASLAMNPGPGNSNMANGNPDTGNPEAEMDKLICDWVDQKRNFFDLVRFGLKKGFWSEDDLLVWKDPNNNYIDDRGKVRKDYNFEIGNWVLSVRYQGANNNSTPSCKGNWVSNFLNKKLKDGCEVHAWFHKEKALVAGHENCLPNPNQVWNESRKGAAKMLPKIP